MIQEILMLLF